jgi:hypothetical protein
MFFAEPGSMTVETNLDLCSAKITGSKTMIYTKNGKGDQ